MFFPCAYGSFFPSDNPGGMLEDVTVADWEDGIRCHMTAPLLFAKEVVPQIKDLGTVSDRFGPLETHGRPIPAAKAGSRGEALAAMYAKFHEEPKPVKVRSKAKPKAKAKAKAKTNGRTKKAA